MNNHHCSHPPMTSELRIGASAMHQVEPQANPNRMDRAPNPQRRPAASGKLNFNDRFSAMNLKRGQSF
jgi:hypothetical protein